MVISPKQVCWVFLFLVRNRAFLPFRKKLYTCDLQKFVKKLGSQPQIRKSPHLQKVRYSNQFCKSANIADFQFAELSADRPPWHKYKTKP
jgi:hypothetical protein